MTTAVQEQIQTEVPGLSLQEHERLYILKTLAECNWNKKLAASMLGINRSSLYSKLKKHDIGRGPSAN